MSGDKFKFKFIYINLNHDSKNCVLNDLLGVGEVLKCLHLNFPTLILPICNKYMTMLSSMEKLWRIK